MLRWLRILVCLPPAFLMFLREILQWEKERKLNLPPRNTMCKLCESWPVEDRREYQYGTLEGLCEGCQDRVERGAAITDFIVGVDLDAFGKEGP